MHRKKSLENVVRIKFVNHPIEIINTRSKLLEKLLNKLTLRETNNNKANTTESGFVLQTYLCRKKVRLYKRNTKFIQTYFVSNVSMILL